MVRIKYKNGNKKTLKGKPKFDFVVVTEDGEEIWVSALKSAKTEALAVGQEVDWPYEKMGNTFWFRVPRNGDSVATSQAKINLTSQAIQLQEIVEALARIEKKLDAVSHREQHKRPNEPLPPPHEDKDFREFE